MVSLPCIGVAAGDAAAHVSHAIDGIRHGKSLAEAALGFVVQLSYTFLFGLYGSFVFLTTGGCDLTSFGQVDLVVCRWGHVAVCSEHGFGTRSLYTGSLAAAIASHTLCNLFGLPDVDFLSKSSSLHGLRVGAFIGRNATFAGNCALSPSPSPAQMHHISQEALLLCSSPCSSLLPSMWSM